jgi:hypothetical protein
MAGGSHTNFDESAFTVGALSGAGILAGALGAGLANYRAAQERKWMAWNATALRGALDLSEALRARELSASRAKDAVIAAQRLTIARLKRQQAIALVRSRQRA